MKAILAQKILMTRIFDESGKQIPVTLIKKEKSAVTQIKTLEKDGYKAIQVGGGSKKKLNKPEIGHLKKSGSEIKPRILFEVKTEKDFALGDDLDINQFKEGESICVTGVSKGKGFAGTVKRHNFNTGPKTHGSHNYRQPGSIGSTYPERVVKGRRMAGHMGAERTTLKSVKIVKIDAEKQEMLILGAVPGPKKSSILVWSHNES